MRFASVVMPFKSIATGADIIDMYIAVIVVLIAAITGVLVGQGFQWCRRLLAAPLTSIFLGSLGVLGIVAVLITGGTSAPARIGAFKAASSSYSTLYGHRLMQTSAATTTTSATTTTTAAAPTTTSPPPTAPAPRTTAGTVKSKAVKSTKAPTTSTTQRPAPAAVAGSTADPFTDSWDVPLSSGAAVAADSAQLVANLVTQYKDNYGSVAVNGGTHGGLPIFTVPSGQAGVSISVKSGCNNFVPATGSEVPIPSNAVPSSSTDSDLIVYQPSTSTEWEFWEASQSGGSWSACWGGKISNLGTSSGVFSGTTGLAASGISYLGTAIREADVQAGAINHAIAVQVVSCNGYVAPAVRGDCGTNSGQVAEGSWLRFPASLAMPAGLTPFAQMAFKAIQNYGMVVTDQSGAVALAAEAGTDWTSEGNSGTDPITASWAGQQEYSALNGMPWSDLEVLQQ